MKRALITIMMPVCLVLSAGSAYGEGATDSFVQNNSIAILSDRQDPLSDHYQENINWLFEQGYSPVSIMMSSVARGQTLADTVYYMSRSRPASVDRYLNIAEDILPSLPGWVCSSPNAMKHRYDQQLDLDDLAKDKTLGEVAKLYFDSNARFVKVPYWQNGVGHIDVDIQELLKYKKNESWWYRTRNPNTKVVVASLYPEDRRIVINYRLEDLQALEQNGVKKVPVMIVYNDDRHIPISDINDYDKITASEVIKRFESEGERVTPVQEWRTDDYHMIAQTKELEELFGIPTKQSVDPAIWQKAVNRMEQQPQKPLHISLIEGSDSERFIDSTVLLAVAKEKSIERLPVIFFYHDTGRQPAGMPSTCLADIKAAAGAGSGGRPPYSAPPPIVPQIFVPPVVDPPPPPPTPPTPPTPPSVSAS